MSVESAPAGSELAQLHEQMRVCRLCYEAGYPIVPGAIFSGGESAEVMIIGQAPGLTECLAGRPFNAASGRRLFRWLAGAGWSEAAFRSRHYITAVTKCYPGKRDANRGDRLPSRAEQTLCRPYLEQELALIRPRLVIPVGRLAISRFFEDHSLDELVGAAALAPESGAELLRNGPYLAVEADSLVVELEKGTGTWIVPLPHPSGASQWMNKPENQALLDGAIRVLRVIREKFAL